MLFWWRLRQFLDKIRVDTLFARLHCVSCLLKAVNPWMRYISICRVVDGDVFAGLGRTQYLSLADNEIPAIPRHILSHLSLLRTLDLNRNRISRIDSDDFKVKCSVLDLSYAIRCIERSEIEITNSLMRYVAKKLRNIIDYTPFFYASRADNFWKKCSKDAFARLKTEIDLNLKRDTRSKSENFVKIKKNYHVVENKTLHYIALRYYSVKFKVKRRGKLYNLCHDFVLACSSTIQCFNTWPWPETRSQRWPRARCRLLWSICTSAEII